MIGNYSTESGSDLAKVFHLRKWLVPPRLRAAGERDYRNAVAFARKGFVSPRRSAAKKRLQRSKIFLICLVALCGIGCRAEKAQDIGPAERVELLALDENDPRPYFHAELKFPNPEQLKLPSPSEELPKLKI